MGDEGTSRCDHRPRYEGLDALRGVAAILVVAFHIDSFYPTFFVFRHGYLGVDIFFMLSGFVIAAVYDGRLFSGSLRVIDYFWIRLARLYPMIILGIVVGAAIAFQQGRSPTRIAMEAALQVLMLPLLRPGANAFPLNPPQWSLFFELAVNAFHATFARRLSTPTLGLITGIGAAAFLGLILHTGTAGVGFAGIAGFAAGFARVGYGFFAGMLIQRLLATGAIPISPQQLSWAALPAVIGAVVVPEIVGVSAELVDVIFVFLAAPLAVWSAASLRLSRLSGRVAAWAGLISYPLYALQQPVIEVFTVHLPAANGHLKIACWLTLFVALCLLAAAVEVLVDAPIRKRLRPASRSATPEVAATAP